MSIEGGMDETCCESQEGLFLPAEVQIQKSQSNIE